MIKQTLFRCLNKGQIIQNTLLPPSKPNNICGSNIISNYHRYFSSSSTSRSSNSILKKDESSIIDSCDNDNDDTDSNDDDNIKKRISITDEHGRSYGTGRRKTSVARVWIKEGSGQVTINDKNLIDYFQPTQRMHAISPFLGCNTAGFFDVTCTVKGGGISGQAGAVRLGISRALEAYNPEYRASLKAYGMLTRDSRRVERKKFGLKKARKAFQWVKR